MEGLYESRSRLATLAYRVLKALANVDDLNDAAALFAISAKAAELGAIEAAKPPEAPQESREHLPALWPARR